MELAAAVLVGGRSRRMGADKARLEVDGMALASRLAAVAAAVASPVFFCGSRDDLADLGLPVVPDRFEGQGPLAGLHAALLETRTEWLLLLACDLPGVEVALLEGVIAHLPDAEHSDADAVVVRTPRGPEPLVALYRRRLAAEIEARLEQGERAAHRLLGSISVIWHDVDDGERLTNLNTPGDLARWQRRGA